MIGVLTLIALLLSVETAQAKICVGDSVKECWMEGQHTITTGDQDYLLVPIPKGERQGLDGLTLITTERADCLAKMQEAMRAMERYSIVGNLPYLKEMEFSTDNSGVTITVLKTMQSDGVRALQLWNTTKEGCWK